MTPPAFSLPDHARLVLAALRALREHPPAERARRLAAAPPAVARVLEAELRALERLAAEWPEPFREEAASIDVVETPTGRPVPWSPALARELALGRYFELGVERPVLDWLEGRDVAAAPLTDTS